MTFSVIKEAALSGVGKLEKRLLKSLFARIAEDDKAEIAPELGIVCRIVP